ncbi:hypothetical protein BJ980_001510 [Nocardioides daedukensis]|uniref:Uncharacterized protein n=1 Tax=Nocardioides daedukensis TaxID=634462 RepID=A0A7Y9UPT5_9ACTN|nr:hypothetical protein [Nocardioides daedukensis]NYG58587.1 hypothetical protein [Nocardioides daedukensis]
MSRRRLLVGSAIVLLALIAAVLGRVVFADDEEPATTPVPRALQSSVEDPFEVIERDQKSWVVGHRLVMESDPGWHIYDPEGLALSGTTWDWAIGEPEDGTAVPAYVSFYAGVPGKSAGFEEVRDLGLEEARDSTDFALIDEGSAKVPGAYRAAFVHFTRSVTYAGQKRDVEEMSLYIDLQDGTTTTVRFFAAEGEWDDKLGDVRDSLRISP